MTVEKRLLRERAKMRKSRPKFRRQESWRYKRLSKSWRRPMGIDNTMRHHKRGWPKIVRIGFRGPKAVRGLTSAGKEEVLIHNVKELEQIKKDTQIARISATVGVKKKVAITNRADELAVKIINRPEEALTFATISELSDDMLKDEDVSVKSADKPRKKKSTGELSLQELEELEKIESQLAGKETKPKKSATPTKKPATTPKTTPKKSTTTTPTKTTKATPKKSTTTAAKKPTTKKTTTTKSSTTKKPTTTATKEKTTSSKKSANTTKAASTKKSEK
ncbi:MAG: 50S ribosomal protein L32e [Candidatus Heimdallarchaeota archaeon]|nr:50S ribosomal protein L32e [Candidatus Heimdallarchaeota archaeon]